MGTQAQLPAKKIQEPVLGLKIQIAKALGVTMRRHLKGIGRLSAARSQGQARDQQPEYHIRQSVLPEFCWDKLRLCSNLAQRNPGKVFGTSCPEKIPQSSVLEAESSPRRHSSTIFL
jgi:hypothetical protein